MTAYTKGPWRIDRGYGGDVRADSGDVCVTVYKGMKLIEVTGQESTIGPDSREEAIANARLIAAAPELLRACELVVQNAPLVAAWLAENDPGAFAQITAAIAKAKGE